jgi:hypothetical protein
MRNATPPTAVATDRVSDRLPIFSALHVLGFSYAEVGRLLGVSTVSVHEWATGKKPLSVIRALALIFLVTRLTGVVGKAHPPQTRYARRTQIAVEAAIAYANLARDELDEALSGVFQAETIERSFELGQRMLARLEAQ